MWMTVMQSNISLKKFVSWTAQKMRSQVKNIFDEFQIKDWGDTSDQDQKTRQRLNVAKMDPLEMYQLMDEEMNKEGGEETRERYTYEGR